MQPPSLFADVLAAVIVLVIPLTAPTERRIFRTERGTAIKLLAYSGLCVLLWTLTVAAVAIVGVHRLLASPATAQPWLPAPAIASWLLGLAVAAYGIIGLMPLLQSLRGPRWRRAYAAAIRRGFHSLPGFLPATADERAAWVVMSLTAGVCEEILFRGFMIGFLVRFGAGMPVAAALAASSVIFGLGHIYQGVRGVLGSTIGGLALGLLFLLTGNLAASIALHVLLDLQMSYVLRPVVSDPVGNETP